MSTFEEKKEIIKKHIKKYPDFPKPGIIFCDIFSVLLEPNLLVTLNEAFILMAKSFATKPDVIVGLDSRGFLFGPLLALEFHIPFAPVRKKGKLPGEVKSVTYDLEYGKDTLEIQCNAIKKNQNVMIVDDLLATGGTMSAASKLIKEIGGNVVGCLVAIEVVDLKGREKLSCPVKTIIDF